LIIATDLRNLTAEKKSIIMNAEVIAINQDRLITAGERLSNTTQSGQPGQVWARPLLNGDQAVILYNPQHFNSSTVGSYSAHFMFI
jgi:alpha-galactosidase